MLTESDSDALIYEALVERLTSQSYFPVCRRMRKGSGLSAVRASMTVAIREIQRMVAESGVCFLISMDNDRAPHATSGDAMALEERQKLSGFDKRKADRYADIMNALGRVLGLNQSNWPVPIGVAVPVEMIESWLLLIAREGRADKLPRFSTQDSSLAIHYFHPGTPPAQLKDCCAIVQIQDGYQTQSEWAVDLIIGKLDPLDLADRSSSFSLLKHWLDQWPPASSEI